MRRSLLTALAMVLIGYALPSPAQMRGGHSSVRFGGGVVVRPGFSGHGVGFRGGVAFGHSPRFGVVIGPRRVFRRPFFSFGFGYPYYPYAYVYPPYYYDSLYYSSYSYPPPPPAYYSNDDSRLADEVYELRGEVAQLRAEQQRDQEERAAAAPPAPVPRPPQASRANEPAPPGVVLVFRDGHRSEVRNYAIVGQTLWMFSEEQARKVPLSTLDIDATTRANEQRGIELRLPANAQPAR